jgi:hypothetical protein
MTSPTDRPKPHRDCARLLASYNKKSARNAKIKKRDKGILVLVTIIKIKE